VTASLTRAAERRSVLQDTPIATRRQLRHASDTEGREAQGATSLVRGHMIELVPGQCSSTLQGHPFDGRQNGGTTVPTTASSARAALPAALVVLAAAGALLSIGTVLAGPAAAIEDPRRPTAAVTRGPSCGPGVVRVAVTNGTVPHRVALLFDGADQQDAADLTSGAKAELVSADIDWGRTVDVSVAVIHAAGTVEQPIEFGTYTRPSAEDCAAITPATPRYDPDGSSPESGAGTTPAAPARPDTTVSTPAPTSVPSSPTGAAPPPTPTAPRSAPPPPAAPPPATSSTTSSPTPTPTPTTPPSTASAPVAVPDEQPSGRAGSSSAATVPRGGIVTVRATGFTPGEPVTVSLLGDEDPLTAVTAGRDGSVQAVVQIPRTAALGSATVRLVGGLSSATAGLDLQVAARTAPVRARTASGRVSAAGVALIGAAGVLGLIAARRSRRHAIPPR
jgi:hypothetical protein